MSAGPYKITDDDYPLCNLAEGNQGGASCKLCGQYVYDLEIEAIDVGVRMPPDFECS